MLLQQKCVLKQRVTVQKEETRWLTDVKIVFLFAMAN